VNKWYTIYTGVFLDCKGILKKEAMGVEH